MVLHGVAEKRGFPSVSDSTIAFSFSVFGDVATSWGYLPARSACCKLESTVAKVSTLDLPEMTYPTDGGPIPSQAARIALYEGTDPASLDEGYWFVLYDDIEEVAYLFKNSSTGNPSAVHVLNTNYTESDDPPFTTYRYSRKAAFKQGWANNDPAWRAMDGDTVTVEYQMWHQDLDDFGNPVGDPTSDAVVALELSVDPGDEEKYNADFVSIPEPGSNQEDYAIFGAAYADRECL